MPHRIDTTELRKQGFHYVVHDYGTLCFCCATDYDLVGEVTVQREGNCTNCGPDDLESRREAK